MNFLEAVKALSEGRATRIRRKVWYPTQHVVLGSSIGQRGFLVFKATKKSRRYNHPLKEVLAEDWVTE